MRFKIWDCRPTLERYGNGRMAIRLIDEIEGFPVAIATVNVPEVDLAEDEVVIEDYSENDGMLVAFLEAGLIDEVVGITKVGFASCPICRINIDKLKSLQ